MPYTHLELESHDWPFPNRYFDPAKASARYKTYVESMIYAESAASTGWAATSTTSALTA